jgi:hypothetical protein
MPAAKIVACFRRIGAIAVEPREARNTAAVNNCCTEAIVGRVGRTIEIVAGIDCTVVANKAAVGNGFGAGNITEPCYSTRTLNSD